MIQWLRAPNEELSIKHPDIKSGLVTPLVIISRSFYPPAYVLTIYNIDCIAVFTKRFYTEIDAMTYFESAFS